MTFEHESINFFLDVLQREILLLDVSLQKQIQEGFPRLLTNVVLGMLMGF